MACAQTGSGKTAAFMVPIVSRLLEEETMNNKVEVGTREPVHPECVVVTPTRELAKQIQLQAKKFCQGSDLRAVVVYGQTSVYHQMEDIRMGCNILGKPSKLIFEKVLNFPSWVLTPPSPMTSVEKFHTFFFQF